MTKKELASRLDTMEEELARGYNEIENQLFLIRKVAQDVNYLVLELQDEPEHEEVE